MTNHAQPPHLAYRPDVDGLRALSLFMVVVFHAFPDLIKGGFISVDIFFVISGFLISTILFKSLASNNFSFVVFYARRTRRIFPSMLIVLFSCYLLGWFTLLGEEFKQLSKHVAGGAFFISNIQFWREVGYFDTLAETKPLLHFWTLGIEEQFYIFWPLLLWFAHKRGFNLFVIALGIAIASFLLNIYTVNVNVTAAFYSPLTRFWELLSGAVLAWHTLHHPTILQSLKAKLTDHTGLLAKLVQGISAKTFSNIQSLTGFTLIVLGSAIVRKDFHFPGFWALFPVMGTVLIISAGPQAWLNRIFLANRVMVWFGLISFPLYLWHWPLLAFPRIIEGEVPSVLVRLIAVGLAILLGWLTYELVEKRVRFYEEGKIKTRTLLILMLALAILAFVTYKNKGFPQRIPEIPGVIEAEIDIPKIDNGWCFYSIDSIKKLEIGEAGLKCWLGDQASSKKALLFGDSFAGHYEPFWDVIGKSNNIAINSVTTNWCHPSQDDSFSDVHKSSRAYQQCLFNRQFLVNHYDNYDLIILSANWPVILPQKNYENFVALIKTLSAKSKPIVLMPSPKQFDGDVMLKFRKSYFYGQAFDINQYPANADKASVAANQLLEDISKQYKNVFYISRSSLFKNSDLTDQGIPYTVEGWHLSIYGSKTAAQNFSQSPQLQEIKKRLAQSHRSK